MARRADPQRINQAREDATRNRLMQSGMSRERADEWLARWAVQAGQDGLTPDAGYWDAGWKWIEERRR